MIFKLLIFSIGIKLSFQTPVGYQGIKCTMDTDCTSVPDTKCLKGWCHYPGLDSDCHGGTELLTTCDFNAGCNTRYLCLTSGICCVPSVSYIQRLPNRNTKMTQKATTIQFPTPPIPIWSRGPNCITDKDCMLFRNTKCVNRGCHYTGIQNDCYSGTELLSSCDFKVGCGTDHICLQSGKCCIPSIAFLQQAKG